MISTLYSKKQKELFQDWVHSKTQAYLKQHEITAPHTTIRYTLCHYFGGFRTTVTWGLALTIFDDPPVLKYWLLNDRIPSLVVHHIIIIPYHWVEFHLLKHDQPPVWFGFLTPTWWLSLKVATTTFHFGKNKFSPSKGYVKNCQGFCRQSQFCSLWGLEILHHFISAPAGMPWWSYVRPSQTIKTAWLPLK